MEPNFKNIKIGMNCLGYILYYMLYIFFWFENNLMIISFWIKAKHSDDLWHLAAIESIDEHHICVQYKKFNLTTALEWEHIFVIDSSKNSHSRIQWFSEYSEFLKIIINLYLDSNSILYF